MGQMLQGLKEKNTNNWYQISNENLKGIQK